MGLRQNVQDLLSHIVKIKAGTQGADQNYQIFLSQLSLEEKQELLELYYLGRDNNPTFDPTQHSEIECKSKLLETGMMDVSFPEGLKRLSNKFPNIAQQIL